MTHQQPEPVMSAWDFSQDIMFCSPAKREEKVQQRDTAIRVQCAKEVRELVTCLKEIMIYVEDDYQHSYATAGYAHAVNEARALIAKFDKLTINYNGETK